MSIATIETNLCAGLSLESYTSQNYTGFDTCSQFGLGKPNVIVANHMTKEVHVLGCNEVCVHSNTPQWKTMISQIPWRFGFGRDDTRQVITLSHDVKNPKLQSLLSIDRVAFNISCEDTVFEDSGWLSNGLYQLLYSGPAGCSLPIKDYATFYKKNFFFLALILVPSLIGIFLKKQHERLAMALASVQAAVMVTAGICVHIDSMPGVSQDNTLYYNLAAFGSFVLGFGLSYFSRTISILFVSIALNYAINWTIFYMYSLIFSKSISFGFFALGISLGVPIVLGVSYYYPRARERYSFGIYTSVTYSFYLATSVAIYFGYYLDVLTFQKYTDFGKTDTVGWREWVCIPFQLVLTVILAFRKFSTFKGHKNYMSDIESQITERKSIKDGDGDLLSRAYRPDHEFDPRPDIQRNSTNKTIIAM
jgi:hypothetical protein